MRTNVRTFVLSPVADRIGRRSMLLITGIGSLYNAFAPDYTNFVIARIITGAILIFAGFNLWVSPTYAMGAESFPTRARTTGFALVDGVGHIGGGIGVLVIAPYLPHTSTLGAQVMISMFLVVAAILAQFTTHTRNRPLDQLSP